MENDFRFHFHFKWFPALENRRERERERARRSPYQSKNTTRSHRSKTITLLRSFKPTLVEPSHRSSRSSRHFWTTRKERDRERQREKEERVERSSHHRQDRLAIVLKPTCTKSPMNPLTPRQSHQIAPRQRTHHSDEPIHQTHHSDEWVFFHSDRAIDEFFLVGFCLEAKKMWENVSIK